MVVLAYNPSIWEVEAERSEFHGCPELHNMILSQKNIKGLGEGGENWQSDSSDTAPA
jgi:hypothetical protein